MTVVVCLNVQSGDVVKKGVKEKLEKTHWSSTLAEEIIKLNHT